MKANRDEFIIIRVKKIEKEYLLKQASKLSTKFSRFIRIKLGLEK